MALKKVKVDKEMQALFDEVEGKTSVQKKPQKFKQQGKAGKVRPVSQQPKPMSTKVQKAFKTLCLKKFQTDKEIETLQKDQSRIKDRIAQSTKLYGQPINEMDSVLFVAPFKTQLEHRHGIDMELVLEWARKNNLPQLILKQEMKTLDVAILEGLIKNDNNRRAAKYLGDALRVVLSYAKPLNLVHDESSEMLNLEQYQKLKDEGVLPKNLIKAAEAPPEGSRPALTIRKLIQGKHRCPGCAEELSKAVTPAFVCNRCGFSDRNGKKRTG